MKIVSWNMNGLIASMKNNAIEPLRERKPDIICFQEIRTQQEPVILNGYTHYWNHSERDGYSGTAVLTRGQEPERVLNGFLSGFPDKEGRLITMEFYDFYLVNAYVPNSQKNLKRHAYRMDWDAALREHLIELMEEKSVILCGDFNVARSELDIYAENMRQYWLSRAISQMNAPTWKRFWNADFVMCSGSYILSKEVIHGGATA